MHDMRWDDVRVFLEVAKTGTLSGAAAALGVNASTVLRRVAALESALGVSLFQRTPRGYALTPTGEAVVEEAGAAHEVMASLRRRATGHDRTASGPVTLTMPETLVSVVAPCLARVQAACPGLRPVIRAEDRMLDLGREADVALRPGAHLPDHTVGRRVGTIAWAVYGTERHTVWPWVAYSEGAGPQAARRWRLAQHGDAPVVMEVTTVGAMHRVLRCTAGQGLLPCFVGDADPTLSRRSDLVTSASTRLWLLLHADLRRSARVRALMDLLVPELEHARPLLEGERPAHG